MNAPLIERGFAVVGAGAWLFGRAQPAAVRGALTRRSLKGFICPDRGSLSVGELVANGSQVASSKSQVPDPKSIGDSSDIQPADLGPETAADGSQVQSPKSQVPDSMSTGNGSDMRPADLGPAPGAAAWCAAADSPFLTLINCGVPVSAVSDKVLVAPASARTGAKLVKVIPFSLARSLRVTEFAPPADHPTIRPSDHKTIRPSDHPTTEPPNHQTYSAWVVMATRSRTTRIALEEDESLGVRPEAAVAWTGARPSGFCPRLRLFDILLPRGPRDLLLHFHGPAIVWIEGSEPRPLRETGPRKAVF